MQGFRGRRCIEAKGEGIYALVLGTDDLEKTATALTTNGMKTNAVVGLENTLELDANATFGARLYISDRD